MDGFIDDRALTAKGKLAIFVDVDSELREEAGKQVASDIVHGISVQCPGFLKQVELLLSPLSPGREPFDSMRELLRNHSLLQDEGVQFLAQLWRSHAPFCREFDEPLFLHFELAKLGVQRLLDLTVLSLKGVRCLLELQAQSEEIVGRQALSDDFTGNRCFDVLHAEDRETTVVTLLSGADPVLVHSPVADVLTVDEPAGAPFGFAQTAVQQTFEVVEMDKVPVPLAIAAIQNRLAGKERFLAHECRVAAGIEHALERQNTGVVRITKDLGEGARRHRAGRAIAWPTAHQAHIVE